MLQDESYDGRVAHVLGPLQGGVTVLVDQLSVGLGTQQRLHARPLSFGSGLHQGGATVLLLEIGAGRVLQQNEQDGEVAEARSTHERGGAEAT